MKPEQLSPEWVKLTKKFELTKFDKIGFDELGSNYYQLRKDIIGDKFITDVANISALSSIDLLQHYQSKVAELIEAKLKHFTSEKDKEQKISTEYKNIQYIVYCSCMIQEYKQLLTDLTNLKP